jgi:hypothetical protein
MPLLAKVYDPDRLMADIDTGRRTDQRYVKEHHSRAFGDRALR